MAPVCSATCNSLEDNDTSPFRHTLHDQIMSLLSLPSDIIDYILTDIPDLASLKSAILSCHTVYATFTIRRDSILWRVYENAFGPAFPQTLTLVCVLETQDSTDLDNGNILQVFLNNEFEMIGENIVRLWVTRAIPLLGSARFRDVTRVSKKIEDYFSVWCVSSVFSSSD